jgi:CelD/BcsL family acetyltransferase involved in cellulose biosynthesis
LQTPGTGVREIDDGILDLLRKGEERPVFLHPAWLRTWLAEFGEDCEACVCSAGDDGLLGVAPLMRSDDTLTFIGDPQICDFMDIVVEPRRREEAYARLWRDICAEDWSQLDLWGLVASSPSRAAITSLAQASGYAVAEEAEAVAPRLELPASWDEYVASLPKKDRHELRRKLRRLFESGGKVELEVLINQADVAAAMDTFLDLHTRSRQDKTDFMTEEMAVFFRRVASALAAEGLVRLFMLRINARPAAAVLCFDAGSYLYMYNSGYDPAFAALSVGLLSKALCLRWAIENGKQGLDFLRGDESYKYDLGAHDQQIYRLRVSR